MKYEIQQEFDFEKGLMFRVMFPEEDVDKKALYTIQNDMPEFLIPFKCRSIDGMMQCTYYVGSDTKLQNRMGTCRKQEYICCWKRILSPLLMCKDWFLNAYSFVFDLSYLYTDKNENYVRYLYIPSQKAASDFSALSSMVADIARENTVEDTAMENAVLRAIMQGFSPKEFLSLVESFDLVQENITEKQNDSKQEYRQEFRQELKTEKKVAQPQVEIKKAVDIKPTSKPVQNLVQNSQPSKSDPFDDIQIHFSDEDAQKKGNFSFRKKTESEVSPEKPVKAKTEKEKGGFFSRLGFGKKKQTNEDTRSEVEKRKLSETNSANADERIYQIERESDDDQDSNTVIGQPQSSEPRLRYIGNLPNMPMCIEVSIGPAENDRDAVKRFTIGRFDINVGRRQSDFEFAENTKGVSRHHAIIERRGEIYFITDLNSSAGTVVNGIILRANQTAELTNNCHVSFGYDGADYIWVE